MLGFDAGVVVVVGCSTPGYVVTEGSTPTRTSVESSSTSIRRRRRSRRSSSLPLRLPQIIPAMRTQLGHARPNDGAEEVSEAFDVCFERDEGEAAQLCLLGLRGGLSREEGSVRLVLAGWD